MAQRYGPVYTSVSQITGPSGWYNIRSSVGDVQVYVDQSYSGGGWVCVLANNNSTGGMNNLTYNDAVNAVNYRYSGTTVSSLPISNLGSLTNLNMWVGLKYWSALSGRLTSNKMTIVQFVSSTKGTALSNTGAHTKRYRWSSSYFNGSYAFNSVAAISDETGTGQPGMYNYHAVNGFSLTTYDLDQDQNSGNCATYYNNNPWWYGSCWSGNYFAGGGYADYPYWDSSGGDYHNFGAVYIK
jgi:hypothetical protein